jgi:riboflavin kinase/FMN adenylyltransferase
VKVYPDLPHRLPDSPQYPVVTIGVFDGVHRGHQKILDTALGVAAGRPVAVVTFDPHPRAVLGPAKRHRLLSPLPERLMLLAQWPVAAVGVLRFDQTIARQSYRDFVRQTLVEGMGAQVLVLGYNVRLGHQREGTPERLAALGQELGFAVELVAAVEVDGEVVSSTSIRHRLDGGDVEGAARLLGRPYALLGTVVRGQGRGRTLGLPTANLEVSPEKLVPSHGVYAVRTRFGDRVVSGALNIGTVPTFQDEGRRSVEVHLLDWEGDLYGSHLRLEFLSRLRDEQRFPDAAALLAAVRADLAEVRRRAQSA